MNSPRTTVSRVWEKRRSVFPGWWVLSAAFIVQFLGAGTWFYGFTLYFKPIIDEFKWSREITSLGFSIARMEGSVLAPAIGWVCDKLGPHRLMIFGVILASIGFFLMSKVNSLLSFYLIWALVVTMGWNFGYIYTGPAAVNNWFIKKRSRAMAIYSVGAGLGGAILVPILTWIVTSHGWRTGFLWAAVICLVIGVPVALLLKDKPEKYGLIPDGNITANSTKFHANDKLPQVEEVNFSVKQAIQTWSFWLLTIGITANYIGMTGVVVHQMAHMTDIGISTQQAGTATGIMLGISTIGRLGVGWLGEIWPKRYIMFVSMVMQGLGVFFLAIASNLTFIYLYVIVYGLFYGGIWPVIYDIRGEYFGRENFATISGFQSTFTTIGAVVGPWFAGKIFDTTQSYYIAFMTFVALYIAGGLILLTSKKPALRNN